MSTQVDTEEIEVKRKSKNVFKEFVGKNENKVLLKKR
jgi:hypothetical protein